jgi:hypothetical protein
MNTNATFTAFLPTEWADVLAFARKQNTRLARFEEHLEKRPVDAYSVKNARVVFEYMRDVAGKPLPTIEKHAMSDPTVAAEYLQYKKDSDPKNDDGGGMVMSLLRRLRNPQIKAAVTKQESVVIQSKTSEDFVQSPSQWDQAFLVYVNDLMAKGERKNLEASFRLMRTGAMHVGQFSIDGDELTLVTGTDWFVFSVNDPSQVISVGHWPKDAKLKDIRNGLAIREAVEKLADMEEGATIPANFKEPDSEAQHVGTLSLDRGKLLLSFGLEDKRFLYDIDYPFKKALKPSPTESIDLVKEVRRRSENLESRKTNILDMIEKKSDGIQAHDGCHYQLSEDKNTVTRTRWGGKADTYTREEFISMEAQRLAPKQEQGMSMGRGMSR